MEMQAHNNELRFFAVHRSIIFLIKFIFLIRWNDTKGVASLAKFVLKLTNIVNCLFVQKCLYSMEN